MQQSSRRDEAALWSASLSFYSIIIFSTNYYTTKQPIQEKLECTRRQSFQIGKWIYSKKEQRQLISQIIDAVETIAEEKTAALTRPPRTDDNSYHDIFEKIESDLLRIAAILKHPSFREEEEWRIVSPVITYYIASILHQYCITWICR